VEALDFDVRFLIAEQPASAREQDQTLSSAEAAEFISFG
jgi:hypothetical protein